MEQTEKKQLHYKKIENISAYVQKLAKEGANLIIAKNGRVLWQGREHLAKK